LAVSAPQPSTTAGAHTNVDCSSGSASGTSTWARTKPAPAMLPTKRSAPRKRLRRNRQRKLRRGGAGLPLAGFLAGLGEAGGAMGGTRGRATQDGTATRHQIRERREPEEQHGEGDGGGHGERDAVPLADHAAPTPQRPRGQSPGKTRPRAG